MSITVGEALTKIAYDLQESDNTFGSGLWAQAEMIGYMNYALGDFVNATGVVLSDVSTVATIGVRSYTRPATCSDIERISFAGKRLTRVSLSDLVAINYKWRETSGNPKYYHEDGISLLAYEFDKTPTKAGAIRIIADLLPTPLEETTDELPIPDCWEPYIRWETISFALSKDGESQDLPRANWAHQKYMFGMDLAMRIVNGYKE